jgi:CheY-like chemotaxis protein/DNA-binding Xre family transcriptional regulator
MSKSQKLFSTNLNLFLKERGFSQNALAKNIGVHATAVLHWVHGRNIPTGDLFDKLCEALSVQHSDFFEVGSVNLTKKIEKEVTLKAALERISKELGFTVKPVKKKPQKPFKITEKPSILFVDDNIELRDAVMEFLLKTGYKVVAADNGKIALKMLEKEHFDIVISDNEMPEISGVRLMQIVADKYPHICRIFASGTISESELLALSPHGLIPKPYTQKQLLECLKNIWLSRVATLKEAR